MSQRDEIVWNSAEILFSKNLEEVIHSSPESGVNSLHCNFHDIFLQAVEKSKRHHIKHVSDTYLKQKSVDIYKVLSWITWYVTDACPDDSSKMIAAISGIDSLNEVLSHEKSSKNLPEQTVRLLQAFLVNEAKGNPTHGIALNGLFIAFHSAKEALKT